MLLAAAAPAEHLEAGFEPYREEQDGMRAGQQRQAFPRIGKGVERFVQPIAADQRLAEARSFGPDAAFGVFLLANQRAVFVAVAALAALDLCLRTLDRLEAFAADEDLLPRGVSRRRRLLDLILEIGELRPRASAVFRSAR